jgi:hypothetical protein
MPVKESCPPNFYREKNRTRNRRRQQSHGEFTDDSRRPEVRGHPQPNGDSFLRMAIFKLKRTWDKLPKEREEWRLMFGLTTMLKGF